MQRKINFGNLMRQVAMRYPNKEAIVNIERNRRYTFMEFHLLTNKICNMMRDRFGLKRDDFYMTILRNDNMMLFNWWMFKAEASAGWAYYSDSKEEHLRMLDFIEPKVVLIENEKLKNYHAPLRERNIQIVCMDPMDEKLEGVHYLWDLLKDASDADTGVEHSDDDAAVYRFTAGTTGKGKCAMYTVKNILYSIYGFYDRQDDLMPFHSKFLHCLPLTHAAAMYILPTYFRGGTNLTMNSTDLDAFGAAIQKEKITQAFFVPTVLYRILEMDLHGKYDLSSLESFYYGASPMDPKKLSGLLQKFGNIFTQFYGSTEAWAPVAALEKADHANQSEEGLKRLSSCGRPTTAQEVAIVDDEGRAVPVGERGEIWVRGPGIVKGYYKNPEQTEEEFVDGWWKSGDIGYMDKDGYIYIVDRKKNMIISGGFNVYANEVESALLSHSAVLMAAAIGIPHDEWGEAVHAEVILKEGVSVTADELIEHVKKMKGAVKTPKTIAFVKELPINAAGKILHKTVREKYWKDKTRKVH